MDEAERVRNVAATIARAIQRRDVASLRTLLAPGFAHRTHGGGVADAETFLNGIAGIPGDITFVRLEQVAVDICPAGALVTGVQHAQVVVSGETIDERRGFVDWFVKLDDGWKVQAAVDLPVG